MSEYSQKICREFAASDAVRDAGLTTPPDIVRYNDLLYGEDPACQALDVYRPVQAQGKVLPVIISVHGGGWVYGDKELYQYYCMSLAQQGFAVLNFSYRLAPDHTFPAQIEDINAVISWMFENRDRYLLDTDHVFAVGDSAGAHLLSLYACICTNPEYAKTYTISVPAGFVPTALGLNCGIYEMTRPKEGEEIPSTYLLMEDLLPQKGTDEEFTWISPIRYVTKDFPPSFIMSATGDFTQENTLKMVSALTRAEVPMIYKYYGGSQKPLGHVFHCNMYLPEGKVCNQDECSFFRSFL